MAPSLVLGSTDYKILLRQTADVKISVDRGAEVLRSIAHTAADMLGLFDIWLNFGGNGGGAPPESQRKT
jgi:hypothetical protein